MVIFYVYLVRLLTKMHDVWLVYCQMVSWLTRFLWVMSALVKKSECCAQGVDVTSRILMRRMTGWCYLPMLKMSSWRQAQR